MVSPLRPAWLPDSAVPSSVGLRVGQASPLTQGEEGTVDSIEEVCGGAMRGRVVGPGKSRSFG